VSYGWLRNQLEMSERSTAEAMIELIEASKYQLIIRDDDSGLKELLGSGYDIDSIEKSVRTILLHVATKLTEEQDTEEALSTINSKAYAFCKTMAEFIKLGQTAKFYESYENLLNFVNKYWWYDEDWFKTIIVQALLILSGKNRGFNDLILWAYNYQIQNPLPTEEEMFGLIKTAPVNKDDSTFNWSHNSRTLESVLDVFEPVRGFFEENALEGFKMALSGDEVDNIPYGCIKPSNNNKTYVTYLFYRLIKAGFISTFRGVDRDALWEHLIGQSAIRKFRHYFSDYENHSVTLKKNKVSLIDQVLDTL
jgi:hypothetical protein